MEYKDIDWEKVDVYDLYVNKKMLTREIAEILKCDRYFVEKRMKQLGITEKMKKDSYVVNSNQHDLLIGSKLGDGTFPSGGKKSLNYRFSITHNEDQLGYLEHKFNTIKSLCKRTDLEYYKNPKFPHRKGLYRFATKQLPILNKYKEMSVMDALNQLNINSLLYWFVDDGTFYQKQKYVTITCASFSLEEVQYAMQKIKEIADVSCTIVTSKREKNGFQGVRMSKIESERFLNKLRDSYLYSDISNLVPKKFLSIEN